MRKYAKTHEWYEDLGNGKVKIGITAHAAHELSDIVFAELPDVGKEIPDHGAVCVLESVKAVSDVYCPAAKVLEVNTALSTKPALINEDPENGGWLVIVQLKDPKALDIYMDEKQYKATLA